MKQGKRAAQALRRQVRFVSIIKKFLFLSSLSKKHTLTHFCPQLSEPRRLGHQLDEENVLLQLNADHVLRHTSQEVMRPHDHSPASEKSGVGFKGLNFQSNMPRVCTSVGNIHNIHFFLLTTYSCSSCSIVKTLYREKRRNCLELNWTDV